MSSEPAAKENIPELPPSPPRESLVSTAVKFLQNPRVADSPIAEKKQFLAKKGLTDEEVEIAITRAGIPASGGAAAALTHRLTQPTTVIPFSPPPPVSVWTRVREYSALAIVIGGVVYGIYTLYKRFIEPIFLRSSEEQKKQLEEMEEGIKSVKDDISKNMKEIRTTMQDMQAKITSQSLKLSQVSADVASSKVDSGYSSVSNSSIGELKAEITSIKGLLLSKNQFPSQPILRPVIPSWQMKLSGPEKTNEVSESDEERRNESNAHDTATTNGEELHSGENGQTNGYAHGDEVKVNGQSPISANE